MASAIPTEKYTYKVPQPPAILVPPLIGDDSNCLNIRPSRFSPSTLEYCGQEVSLEHLDGPLTIDFQNSVEWHREWRYNTQQILPRVYLGPQKATKDLEYLKREGITMLIGVVLHQSIPIAESATNKARQLGIEVQCLGVESNATTYRVFGMATALINAHIFKLLNQDYPGNSRGKVMVFCETGNDKSAAVVAAYIIEMFLGIDEVRALQIIGKKRYCLSIEDSIKQTLRNWSDMQKARRDVAFQNSPMAQSPMASNGLSSNLVPGPPAGGLAKARKRSRTDLQDDEAMDVDFETGPTNQQPFQDSQMN